MIPRLGLAILVLATGCRAVFGIDTAHGYDAGGHPDGGDAEYPKDAPHDALDASMTGDAMADATLQCPNTYIPVQQHVYRIVASPTDWSTAQADCADDSASGNTHLAVVDDDTERSLIFNTMGTDTWVGLSDRVTEGTYLWVTDQDTGGYPGVGTSAWGLNQPSGTTAQNCIYESGNNGRFADEDCTKPRPYVCECDLYANNPANY